MKKLTKRILGTVAVAIPILLLIAIFLPSLLTAKIAAQETAALTTLLSIYEAEKKFQSQNSSRQYGSLQELATAGLIDAELARGERGGYKFELNVTANSFEAHATPVIYGRYGFRVSGSQSFFINERRVITVADKKGAKAGPEDETIP